MSRIEILLALGLALAAAWFAWWLRGWLRRIAMQRRFARGRIGEVAAVRLLERAGYAIVDEQLAVETGFWVDESWRPVTVRADYLVERRGRRYVVEVKTGRSATNPASTATRRQLFEYSHVYQTDGLILADMETGLLHHVRFAGSTPVGLPFSSGPALWFSLISGALLGFALAHWLATFTGS